MAVESNVVTVATTATLLATGGGGTTGGTTVTVRSWPVGNADVFVGSSVVTTANGMPLSALEMMSFDLSTGEALYGIVASGTVAVRVMEHRI